MFEAELDDLFNLLYLLVQAAEHVVGAVGDFLDHHEGDEGIDGAGEERGEFVAVGEEGDAFAGCEFRDVDVFFYVDDCCNHIILAICHVHVLRTLGWRI